MQKKKKKILSLTYFCYNSWETQRTYPRCSGRSPGHQTRQCLASLGHMGSYTRFCLLEQTP